MSVSDTQAGGPWLLVKRDLYYRPNDQGYTGIRDRAGRYSYEEAKARASDADGISMVRLAYAPEFRKSTYQDVLAAHLLEQRDKAQAELALLRTQKEKLVEALTECLDVLDLADFYGLYQPGSIGDADIKDSRDTARAALAGVSQ